MPRAVRKTLALFRSILGRYARPGPRQSWPPLRLFYLAPRPGAEEGGSREGATTFHVIQQPVPWPRALTERVSNSASRFVERVVAKASHLRERLVAPVQGTTELVYVLGRTSAGEDIGAAASAPARAEAARRLAQITVFYGAASGEGKRPGGPAAGLSIYDAPGVRRAEASQEAPAYGRALAAGPGRDAGTAARTPRTTRAVSAKVYMPGEVGAGLGAPRPIAAIARAAVPRGEPRELVYGPRAVEGYAAAGSESRGEPDLRAEAKTAPRGEDVKSGTSVAADADKVHPDYRAITVNLDYEYLNDRLYKMFEETRRIEMERRGII